MSHTPPDYVQVGCPLCETTRVYLDEETGLMHCRECKFIW